MILPTHIVAVAGITEDEHGNILLVKTVRNSWVYPGGQVDVGENLMEAVIRETKEESGIDVVVNKLIGVYSNTCTYPGYNGVKRVPTKVMLDFTCTPVGGDLGISDETVDSKWVKKEEVLNYITAPSMVDRFKAYLEQEDDIRYLEYVTKPDYSVKEDRDI